LIVQRVVGVGRVDDFPEQHERRIMRKIVFLDDRLEGALFAVIFPLRLLGGPAHK
jgi:hypothetical protein